MREDEILINQDNLLGTVWIGVVVDNNDPKFEGRLKVKVYGKYDDFEDSDLPWSYHMSSINGGSSGGFGELSVPKKGQIVQVTFMNGDKLSPYWLSFPKINQNLKDEISKDYIDSRTLVYDEDAKLKIMYLPKTGLSIFLDESEILIGTDNAITIKHKESKSKIELKGSEIKIESESLVEVESKEIKLGANAAEAVVKGDTFKSLYDTHIHTGNLGAPTSPPLSPLAAIALSTKVKTE